MFENEPFQRRGVLYDVGMGSLDDGDSEIGV